MLVGMVKVLSAIGWQWKGWICWCLSQVEAGCRHQGIAGERVWLNVCVGCIMDGAALGVVLPCPPPWPPHLLCMYCCAHWVPWSGCSIQIPVLLFAFGVGVAVQ